MTNYQQELLPFSAQSLEKRQSNPMKFVYLLIVVKVFVHMNIPAKKNQPGFSVKFRKSVQPITLNFDYILMLVQVILLTKEQAAKIILKFIISTR